MLQYRNALLGIKLSSDRSGVTFSDINDQADVWDYLENALPNRIFREYVRGSCAQIEMDYAFFYSDCLEYMWIYACMYVFMFVCVHVCVCVCVHVCVCVCACMCACVYVYVPVCMYV